MRGISEEVLTAFRRAPGHILSHRALDRLGVRSWRRSALVAAGVLDRLVDGQFRIHGDDVPRQAAHLAVSYCRTLRPDEPVLISGEAALEASGHDIVPPDRPLALVGHGRRLRRTDLPFDVAQRVGLDALTVQVHRGLPTPELAEVLADVASRSALADQDLLALLYRVINRTRYPVTALVAAWARMSHPGARRLLDLAATGALEHESPGERSFFDAVFRPHPPLPDCQVQIAPNIRVDFLYVFAALVIEYYGEAEHAGQVDRDGSRMLAVRNLDFDALVVTKGPARNPAALAAQIHRLRREREELMCRGLLPRPALPAQPDRLTPLRTLTPLG